MEIKQFQFRDVNNNIYDILVQKYGVIKLSQFYEQTIYELKVCKREICFTRKFTLNSEMILTRKEVLECLIQLFDELKTQCIKTLK